MVKARAANLCQGQQVTAHFGKPSRRREQWLCGCQIEGLLLGELIEDLTRAQVSILALETHPIVEGLGIAEREILQELATREVGCVLELG